MVKNIFLCLVINFSVHFCTEVLLPSVFIGSQTVARRKDKLDILSRKELLKTVAITIVGWRRRAVALLLTFLAKSIVTTVAVKYAVFRDMATVGTGPRSHILWALRIIAIIAYVAATVVVKLTDTHVALVGMQLIALVVAHLAVAAPEVFCQNNCTRTAVRRIMSILKTLHHSVMTLVAPAIRDMCLVSTLLFAAEVRTLVDRGVRIPGPARVVPAIHAAEDDRGCHLERKERCLEGTRNSNSSSLTVQKAILYISIFLDM